jgi:hypothetical protein
VADIETLGRPKGRIEPEMVDDSLAADLQNRTARARDLADDPLSPESPQQFGEL